MTALNKMLDEIREFDGDPFTLVDVVHYRYARSYLKTLITDGEIVLLPETTNDFKEIYRHSPNGDYGTRVRLAERRLFYKTSSGV